MKTTDNEFFQKVQERIANISIGPSTLRNQGPKGTIRTAREFLLYGLALEELCSKTKDEFNEWLNLQTEDLMRNYFPEGARNNWGAARKAINVFLETAFYNRFLAETYDLQNLEDKLEIPLDSNVVEKLRKDSDFLKLNCPWDELVEKKFTIKRLISDDSAIFQKCASEVAKRKYKMHRIYLDLYYWKAETKEAGNTN